MGPVILIAGWIGFAIIQLAGFALALFGAPLILLLAATKSYTTRPSLYYPYTITVWKGGWPTWIWGNEEDGIDGLRGGNPAQFWWRDKTASWPTWKRIWVWSAWRNSVNNLRFLVKWVGGPRWEPVFRGQTYRFGWNPNGFPVLERL